MAVECDLKWQEDGILLVEGDLGSATVLSLIVVGHLSPQHTSLALNSATDRRAVWPTLPNRLAH